MNLLKIVSIISFSTIATLISGFFKGKIMAVYFGSSGLGIWSQASSLFMICSTISLFGLNQGLIKEISGKEKHDITDDFISDTLSKSLFFSLCNSLIILSVIIFCARYISAFFFNGNLRFDIIIFIAVFLPMQVAGDVFSAFLLAQKQLKKFVLANILISIFGLLTFCMLVFFYKLNGAYYSIGVYGLITFFFFYFVSKPSIQTGLIGLLTFRRQLLDWDFFKRTLTFGVLRLVQTNINPINMLLIRSLIIKKIGLVETGFIEALTRISILYTPFITNILWSHTFPIYCENRDSEQLGYEVNKFTRLSLVLFVPVCVTVMLFGEFFVNLLFSRSFVPVISLFSLWFIVDLLRITSWPMNIVLIAKDKMKLAVYLELFWNIALLSFTYFLIERYSLKGVIISYIISFAIFLFINCVIMNKKYAIKFNAKTFLVFCISAALILVSGRTEKALLDYIIISTLSLIFFSIVLNKQEMLLMMDTIKSGIARIFSYLKKSG